MCGFAFLFDARIGVQEGRKRMDDCLAALWHRGPDDGRIESSEKAILGHRRLSIIDLCGSAQPMQDSSGRYCLTYNGEIYNYVAIREKLQARWDFSTVGDTEVLLAGLVLEGPGILEELEGMWAFALWDASAQRLLLGRDRMGKKPLFFQGLLNGGIACASELPALRKLTTDPWHEDENGAADYLRYGYPMPGYTLWQEVREVLPGHFVCWHPGCKVKQYSWWQLKRTSFLGDTRRAQQLLREAVVEAVQRRMVADVEVGAFLSGGIDSSLICAIICKELSVPLKTFTIGFEEEAFDERKYARLASCFVESHHYEQVLNKWDENELERLIWKHVGQPFADSSLLPTSIVSSVAAKYVKVALSGDGGDELFSGYQRYQARNILRWYTRLPKRIRPTIEKTIRKLPEPTVHHSRSLLKKAHLFMDIVRRQKAETPYVAPLMFDPEQLRSLAPDLQSMGHRPPCIPEQCEISDIGRMMFADALVYLPQDILVKVDRASMAHSLETRAPFLDTKVVELAFSFPADWHRRWSGGKRMLYAAFKDYLPPALWRRRKQGFGVPIHGWFRGHLGDRLIAELYDNNGPLSTSAVENLLFAHRHGGRDHGYRLWLLYSYLLWRKSRK